MLYLLLLHSLPMQLLSAPHVFCQDKCSVYKNMFLLTLNIQRLALLVEEHKVKVESPPPTSVKEYSVVANIDRT